MFSLLLNISAHAGEGGGLSSRWHVLFFHLHHVVLTQFQLTLQILLCREAMVFL